MKSEIINDNAGILFVDSIEDIYKIAAICEVEQIPFDDIELENNIIILSFDEGRIKVAVEEEIEDVPETENMFVYLGGHPQLDTMFTTGEEYPINFGRNKIVLKTNTGNKVLPANQKEKLLSYFSSPQEEDKLVEQMAESGELDKMKEEDISSVPEYQEPEISISKDTILKYIGSDDELNTYLNPNENYRIIRIDGNNVILGNERGGAITKRITVPNLTIPMVKIQDKGIFSIYE